MKILRQIGAGTYGIAYEEAPPAGGLPPADPPSGGLPPQDPPAAGLPPQDPPPADPNAPPPTAYDFTTDTAGLNAIDLQGTGFGGGKFKSVADLDKGYVELESFKGKKSEELAKELGYFAPETYDFGDSGKDWDEKTTGAVADIFKGGNCSQEQVAYLMPHLMEATEGLSTIKANVELMERWNLTGEAFKAKEADIVTWAKANLPPESYARYAEAGAQGMLEVEGLMALNKEKPLWSGAGHVDTKGGQEKIVAIEAKMTSLKKGSAEYTQLENERNALYKVVYPG